MGEIRFSLRIPPHEYERFYRGHARHVLATAHDGRTVQFPAEHLRKFVTREGVHGEFVIRFDRNNKFVGLDRISP